MRKCFLWESVSYGKVFLIGDFNAEETNFHIIDFCNLYMLENLIKTPTCFKNLDDPKTIDLMLTNSARSFEKSCAVETGLSDIHQMTVTILKPYLEMKHPKIISYRDFRRFSNNEFRTQILRIFSTLYMILHL